MLHPADIPNNLPESLRSFVGRARAIGELRALLEANGLVTLVGMGGVGKTRLALQVAAQSMERYGGGKRTRVIRILKDEDDWPMRPRGS